MNKLILLLTLSISTASAFTATAQSQDICATHTVVSGDTLRDIAQRTYGSPRDYRYIYEANRKALGLSPHAIRVGMVLELPCIGDLGHTPTPAPTQVTISEPIPKPKPAPAPVPTPAPAPVAPPEIAVVQVPVEATPTPPPVTETSVFTLTPLPQVETTPDFEGIKIVGFTDNPPYSDPGLTDGGLISKILQTALMRGEATKIAAPTFISSPAFGLTTSVLPDVFQLSFPWMLPNCDLVDDNPDIRDLCENYTFSAPIFEAQMAMFVLSDGPFANAKTEKDIVGARLCRPASMNTYDLLEDGSLQPAIALETAAEIANCFADLHNDIVDIVSVNGLTADMYFTGSDEHSSTIVELSDLATNHTLHAITRKDDIIGNIALAQLNTGLWDMFATGEWGKTAKDYLTAQLK